MVCKLTFAILLSLYSAQARNPLPWEPTPVDADFWHTAHNSFLQNSLQNGRNIKAVFIGSSTIANWATTGGHLWNSNYAPLGAVNYGIPGDRTENVIWRIQNGELDNMSGKLIVVYVGSNNVVTQVSVEEIVRGVRAVLEEIRNRLPKTRILYLEFFPRGDGDIENRWQRMRAVSEAVGQLADSDKLTSFSLFSDLSERWLTVKKEFFENDLLHLNKDGYQKWHSAWNSTFNQLFNAPPLGTVA